VLTVRVPYSYDALQRERRMAHAIWQTALVAVGCTVAAAMAVEPLPVRVWVIGAGLAVLAFFVACGVLNFTRVGVRLDASRRWVTLSRVDPTFAGAVEGMYAARQAVGSSLDASRPV
jgi:hypothetical protein